MVSAVLSAFDTENESNGDFIQGIVVTDNDVARFTDSAKLRRHLKQLGGVAYANNLFYDFGNLYSNNDFNDDIIEINSGRTCIRQARFIALKYLDSPTLFFDVFNYLRMSVEKMGDLLGFPKRKFDPHDPEYCERDARIVLKAARKCVEFADDKFGCRPMPTTASYSMAIYKAMKFTPIPQLGNNKTFAKSYFGGRTEAFYIGRKRMSIYDINSAYPFAMKQEIPFGRPEYIRPSSNFRDTDFVLCAVDIPENRYGLLPVKYGFGGLCFPVGRISGGFWGIELNKAIEYGARLMRVENIIRYRDTGNYLSDYVDALYEMRLKYSDDLILKSFIKLVLNSFYGKLAAKNIVQKIVTDSNYDDIYNESFIFHGKGRIGIVERDFGFNRAARVDIASYITARVRSILLDAIMKYQPYYCDTDSIFIDPRKRPDNVSNKLGDFKFEGTYTLNIVGAKMYFSDDGVKVACKGVPAAKQLDALRGETIKTQRPRTWLTAFKKGEKPNQWIDFVKTIRAGGDNRFGIDGFTEPLISWGKYGLQER